MRIRSQINDSPGRVELVRPLEACYCSATEDISVGHIHVNTMCFVLGPPELFPGEQCRGTPSAESLYPRAWRGYSRAPVYSESSPGGLPQQEGGDPVHPSLREARPVGARRPDGLHTGAAQGDRCTLLCAGCQNHPQQVTHIFNLVGWEKIA